MAAHRAPHKAVEAGEWQIGPDWNTGICECLSDSSVLPGNTTCCVMCCLSVFGCDYWLWKDIDERYEERNAGVQVTYPSKYTPPTGSLSSKMRNRLGALSRQKSSSTQRKTARHIIIVNRK